MREEIHGFIHNKHFFKRKCDGTGIYLEWVLKKLDNTMIIHPFYCECKTGRKMKRNKIFKPFLKNNQFYFPLDSFNKPVHKDMIY